MLIRIKSLRTLKICIIVIFVDIMLIRFLDTIPTSLFNVGRPNTKYILSWNTYDLIAAPYSNVFSKLNCAVSNCVFTVDRELLGNYARFDAILFHYSHLYTDRRRPKQRTNSQIYIFTSVESSANYPACELYNDNFFNWTFTHRLDSDVVWNYFLVRNVTGDIVAPSKDVQWVTNKDFISPKIRTILQGRRKAAAWFVSNCEAYSKRDVYLTRLQEHLFHYSLTIDVYGKCTDTECENDNCEEMLRNNYHFYMAFENSFAEDYVSEKVLHGYDNYVVPIVFGGANYSRFLPPGSYINAKDYHPYNLANIMYQAINDNTTYERFLKWTNFYTIDLSGSKMDHPLCDLCEELQSERAKHAPVKENFRLWWNSMNGMKWCLPPEYWNETAKYNID